MYTVDRLPARNTLCSLLLSPATPAALTSSLGCQQECYVHLRCCDACNVALHGILLLNSCRCGPAGNPKLQLPSYVTATAEHRNSRATRGPHKRSQHPSAAELIEVLKKGVSSHLHLLRCQPNAGAAKCRQAAPTKSHADASATIGYSSERYSPLHTAGREPVVPDCQLAQRQPSRLCRSRPVCYPMWDRPLL